MPRRPAERACRPHSQGQRSGLLDHLLEHLEGLCFYNRSRRFGRDHDWLARSRVAPLARLCGRLMDPLDFEQARDGHNSRALLPDALLDELCQRANRSTPCSTRQPRRFGQRLKHRRLRCRLRAFGSSHGFPSLTNEVGTNRMPTHSGKVESARPVVNRIFPIKIRIFV